MPWIWNPLWGNVWVGTPRVRKSAGQGSKTRNGCAGKKKMSCDEPVVEQKNDRNAVESQVKEEDKKNDILKNAVDSAKEKPCMPKKASAGDLCGNELNGKFDQVGPGVFKFKHPKTTPSKSTASDINDKYFADNTGSVLTDALGGKYKKVGTASDGTPVFAFT